MAHTAKKITKQLKSFIFLGPIIIWPTDFEFKALPMQDALFEKRQYCELVVQHIYFAIDTSGTIFIEN